MTREYGIVMRRRLRNAMISENWISALNTFRNKSDTLADLRKRTIEGLDELILLAKKVPRDELVKIIPPEKLLQLCQSYLNNDPTGEQLQIDQNKQHALIKQIEESREISAIYEKRESLYGDMVAARGKKGRRHVSEEQSKN